MATTIFDFPARAADIPASGGASFTVTNGRLVLAFDASSDEAAVFEAIVPQVYGGGDLTAHLYYAMATATTAEVMWTVEIEALADGEAWGSDSFDTANSSGAITVPGSAGTGDVASVALSSDDGLVVGDLVRFRVKRDADNVADDATGDAYLYRIEIREA